MSDEKSDSQRRRNIVLIGFMGTGKSAVGQRVAASLGFAFVDTDHLIEERAGKRISRIFAEDGEEEFRKLETTALRAVSHRENQVISTGGGIVTVAENRSLLEEVGHVIWLTASTDVIYERVRHNRDRPLLKVSEPKQVIDTMIAEREPLYRECADVEVNTTNLSLEETAHGVTETAIFALGAS